MVIEHKTLFSVFRVFLRVGLYSFNAGASDILLRETVERRSWLSHADLSRLMALAAIIPGPFHVNLVIAAGNAVAGFRGGLTAVIAFVLPGFAIASLVAFAIGQHVVAGWLEQNPGIIRGLVVSVAGLLLSAIVRLGKRTLSIVWLWLFVPSLAAAMLYLRPPFAAVLGLCGLMGALYVMYVQRRQGEK
ncbi:MAG: chromate transporter [Leptospiraceae bacterium]|nr:chromate transporter [Leptospiraceae bacterium]